MDRYLKFGRKILLPTVLDMMDCNIRYYVMYSTLPRGINPYSGNPITLLYQEYLSSLLQLEQSVETANDRAEVANHDLKADIERWHKNKRQDFRKLFMDYSECLIEYFKQVIMHATSLFLSTKMHVQKPTQQTALYVIQRYLKNIRSFKQNQTYYRYILSAALLQTHPHA